MASGTRVRVSRCRRCRDLRTMVSQPKSAHHLSPHESGEAPFPSAKSRSHGRLFRGSHCRLWRHRRAGHVRVSRTTGRVLSREVSSGRRHRRVDGTTSSHCRSAAEQPDRLPPPGRWHGRHHLKSAEPWRPDVPLIIATSPLPRPARQPGRLLLRTGHKVTGRTVALDHRRRI